MNDAKKDESMAADGIRGPGELQMAPSVNHNHNDSGAGDELVSSVTLYRRRPRLLHGTVLPFLAVLYPGWVYVWLGVYGASEYPEAGLLALAAIGIAHVLTALSGYWSVHVHCWLTCSKVNTVITNYVHFYSRWYKKILPIFFSSIKNLTYSFSTPTCLLKHVK